MSFKNLKYEVVDGVAVIAFADPGTLNALTAATVTELREAFTRAEKEARCAILTGEGRGFSSGANLSGGGGGPTLAEDGKPDAGATLETHFNPLVTQMRNLSIPWITAVNGPAAGVGCSATLSSPERAPTSCRRFAASASSPTADRPTSCRARPPVRAPWS